MPSSTHYLLYVGNTPEFPPSSIPPHRSAAEAVFSMRASDLQTLMDDAEVSCQSLEKAFVAMETGAGNQAVVVEAGKRAVSDLDRINYKALSIGAIDFDAFTVLEATDQALLDRCQLYMPTALTQVDKDLHMTLDKARIGNGRHLTDLKNLCWQIEGVHRFWEEKVMPRIGQVIESIRADVNNTKPIPRL